MRSSVINLDKTGVICSGLCAAHCLLTPLLVSFSPSFALVLKNEWIHTGLLIFIFPNALYIFLKSRGIHGSITPLILGTFGLFFLLSAFLSEGIEVGVDYLEPLLTIIGSALLALANVLNLRKRILI